MTLLDLYQQTLDWTARHIIQDEITMFGPNDLVSAYLLNKVKAIEEKNQN